MVITPIKRSATARRGTAEAPRARRRSAGETEKVLLDAARAAFERKGYIRTTVDDIVERTGLSRAAFYRYFRNADAVFVRIATDALDHLLQASRAAPPTAGATLRERVASGHRHFLLAYQADRLLFRSLLEADQVNPEIAAVHAHMRSVFVLRIREHLARQHALGRCHPIDLDATSFALAMMGEGVAQAWLGSALQPFRKPLVLEQVVRELTDIWCRTVYLDADVPLLPVKAAAQAPHRTARKKR